MGNQHRNKKKIIVFVISFGFVFFCFFFFRLYNYQNRISFGWDQEQPAFQIKQLVIEHKPILLGPRVLNDKGFFLAPYYTYFITPFFLLTHLHPVAYFLFIIFYNILFFFTAYTILKMIFDVRTSLLFLALWAINPMMASYDVIPWNPIAIPLGVLLCFWILKKIFETRAIKYWVVLGVVLALFINFHFQFIFICLFSVAFTTLHAKKLQATFLKIFIASSSFAVLYLPLLIFDMRHNFLNLHLFINFFINGTEKFISNPFAWMPVFNNVLSPILFVRSDIVSFLFYLFVLATLIMFSRKKKGYPQMLYQTSIILWVLFPILFAKYGKRPSEYYFIFLYPIIYIVIAGILTTMKKKYAAFLLLLFLIVINFHSLMLNLFTNPSSLNFKDRIIHDLADYSKGKKFNISYTVPIGGNAGFSYLIDYYRIKQTGNWSDPLVQIKIPVDRSCRLKSGDIGVIIPKELSN